MDTGANPIPRGQTYYGTDGTIPSDYGTSVSLEGRRHTSPAYNPDSSIVRRNGGDVKSIIVRNTSGLTLNPGDLVIWDSDYRLRRVAGRAFEAAGEVAGIVDDMLSSSGVRNGDLFHLLVEGLVLSRLSKTAAEAVVTAGDTLIAAAAATSGATTGGCFKSWGGTFSTTETTDGTAAKVVMNRIGRAVSACTTAHTGSLRLVDLKVNR